MHPTIFKFGPLKIDSFGVMTVIAFSAGLYVAIREARCENISGLDEIETERVENV